MRTMLRNAIFSRKTSWVLYKLWSSRQSDHKPVTNPKTILKERWWEKCLLYSVCIFVFLARFCSLATDYLPSFLWQIFLTVAAVLVTLSALLGWKLWSSSKGEAVPLKHLTDVVELGLVFLLEDFTEMSEAELAQTAKRILTSKAKRRLKHCVFEDTINFTDAFETCRAFDLTDNEFSPDAFLEKVRKELELEEANKAVPESAP